MRALDPEVGDAVFEAIKALLPDRPDHPLGCHRKRIPDRLCFKGLLYRLVTGAAWTTIEHILDYEVSDTTLRTRRDEWVDAGVFDKLVTEAIKAYDQILGLDLTDVAIDGSNKKAPSGGQGTGRNPFDKAKLGYKWCMAVDKAGIPIGWTLDGANRHDFKMLEPTLDQIQANGYIQDIDCVQLDRGFSYKSTGTKLAAYGISNFEAPKRQTGNNKAVKLVGLGKRWIVEATNSWLTDYGQIRRNTDTKTSHRHAAICLAITFLITARLITYRDKYKANQKPPIR